MSVVEGEGVCVRLLPPVGVGKGEGVCVMHGEAEGVIEGVGMRVGVGRGGEVEWFGEALPPPQGVEEERGVVGVRVEGREGEGVGETVGVGDPPIPDSVAPKEALRERVGEEV